MNDNNGFDLKNVIFAMLASATILIVWNMMFPPPVPEKSETAEITDTKKDIKSDLKSKVEPEKKVEVNKIAQNSNINYNTEEKTTTLESDKFKATFSSYGASIKFYALKGTKYTIDKEKTKNIVLIDDKDILSYSLSLNQGNNNLYAANLPFNISTCLT